MSVERLVPVSLVLLGLIGALVVWIHAIQALDNSKPVPLTARPTAVVWGDRVFLDKAHFAAWLEARGLSYARWATRHPAGLRILDPKQEAAYARAARSRSASATGTASKAGKKTTTGTNAVPDSSPVAASATAGKSSGWRAWQYATLALAIMLGALTVVPRRFAWRLTRNRFDLLPQRRAYLCVSAVSIAAGLVVAALLT